MRTGRRTGDLGMIGLAALALLAAGSGCATRADVMKTERELSAAGFQMRLADTPEKLEQIKALPQRQMVAREHLGRPFFLWADAKDCKCLYVGTERAHRRYARISLIGDALQTRRETAEAREAAAMDLDSFGPWAPWWF